MNVSTFLIAALVAAVFLAIIVGGILRRKKHQGGGCGCGCSGCPNNGICHPPAREPSQGTLRRERSGLPMIR